MTRQEIDARLESADKAYSRDVWTIGTVAALVTVAWGAFLLYCIPDLIAKL